MTFYRNLLLLTLLLFLQNLGYSQINTVETDASEESIINTDSLSASIDTTSQVKKEKLSKRLFGKYPSPRTALTLSLIIPGAGQVYNKKYWKVPIVYGTMGYMIWKISENKSEYENFRDAYAIRVDGNEDTIDEYVNKYSAAGLKQARNLKKKNLESNYFLFVLAYVLNGLDAYVDAHLLEFDVSEDLSLSIDPAIYDIQGQGITSSNLGLKVALNF